MNEDKELNQEMNNQNEQGTEVQPKKKHRLLKGLGIAAAVVAGIGAAAVGLSRKSYDYEGYDGPGNDDGPEPTPEIVTETETE